MSSVSSQQSQDVGPTLVYCCATVRNDGPTLNQHWVSLSCSLCSIPDVVIHTLNHAITIRRPKVDLMLGQRLRCWANISLSLFYHFVLRGYTLPRIHTVSLSLVDNAVDNALLHITHGAPDGGVNNTRTLYNILRVTNQADIWLTLAGDWSFSGLKL